MHLLKKEKQILNNLLIKYLNLKIINMDNDMWMKSIDNASDLPSSLKDKIELNNEFEIFSPKKFNFYL